MGDSSRFNVFANYIKANFKEARLIADVAGGKGALQIELRKLGYKVVTYDKRRSRVSRNLCYKHAYFNSRIKDHYDLLVGMHPDEATDIIVTEAIKRNIPFCIVPCCITPYATQYNGDKNRTSRSAYTSWINHLKQIAEHAKYRTILYDLPIKGKNIVLLGRPNKH